MTPEGPIPTSGDTRTGASRVPALFSDFPSIPGSGASGSVYDDVPPNELVRGLKGLGIIIKGRNGSRKQRNRPGSPETRTANNGAGRAAICAAAPLPLAAVRPSVSSCGMNRRVLVWTGERADPRSPVSSRWIFASENR